MMLHARVFFFASILLISSAHAQNVKQLRGLIQKQHQEEKSQKTKTNKGLSGHTEVPVEQPQSLPGSLSLKTVLFRLCGPSCLKPSANSLVGQYLKETGAQTLVRRFWRANNAYSMNPPHELGPERLVIAVSAETFSVFKKYFSSKNFLILLNYHGNLSAFEGMTSRADPWYGHVLETPLTQVSPNYLAIPIVLDDFEGDRARDYFRFSFLIQQLYRNERFNYARHPWLIPAKNGGYYSGRGAFATGCGTWIGNMPIGHQRVDRYYFSMGVDENTINQDPLREYDVPQGINGEAAELMKRVWTVPGHQQLGEMIDPGANRRGEFDSAGWTTTTLVGSAKQDRVPIVFYGVYDAKARIPKDFAFFNDGEY